MTTSEGQRRDAHVDSNVVYCVSPAMVGAAVVMGKLVVDAVNDCENVVALSDMVTGNECVCRTV